MRTRLMKARLLTPILLALLFVVGGGNALGQFEESTLYQITAKHSGRCLSVAGGSSSRDNGVDVVELDCGEADDSQRWQIKPVGFGWYKIIAKHSGKALETRGGERAVDNRVAVQQWGYVSAANQQWLLNPVGDDFYQIVARHSGKSLDVNGGPGATGNGASVQQWDYWGGDNQKWKLTALPDFVTGSFTYTDTEADPRGSGTFARPIAGCRVEVWRAGALASRTETDNDGKFMVSVPHMPDGTDTTVLVYATNRAAQVLGGLGPFFVTTAAQRTSQGTTLVFNKRFDDINEVRSFNAAHDIRLAFNFAQARRDPAETEVIPTVDVSFMDHDLAGTRYNHPASSLLIHHSHQNLDLVIMHEYAHFLEDKIGGFLVLPSFHDGCSVTQIVPTMLINSPENAWMEGFADYFAMAVKRANPAAQFNLTSGGTSTEEHLNAPPPCSAVGRVTLDGRTIDGEMIESFVASVLWKASMSPGSDDVVFQIFDRELDGTATGRLPNIRLFRDAFMRRPGVDRARLNSILRDQIPTLASEAMLIDRLTLATPIAPTIVPAVILAATSTAGAVPAEVEQCKSTLQSGTISWGAGTTWESDNIDRLCNNTRNARNTISCFQSNVMTLHWSAAIDRCR